MASEKGWIKLHRDIKEHWVWEDPKLLRIWIDILLTANHQPGKISVKNNIMDINRGQFWTSFRKLSARWGCDTKTVKRYLELLQSDGMISIDPRPGYGTLVTVDNYEVYQGFSKDDSHRDSYGDSYRAGFDTPTEIPYKQEYKNDIRMNKNEKKKAGPLPGDPDYFEEV